MNIVKILLKEALIILILFNLGRFLFLLEYGSLDSLMESAEVFVHSLRLDLSTIAECLVLLYLSIALRPLLKGRITYYIARYSSILLMIIISLIYAGEIVTYTEWGPR